VRAYWDSSEWPRRWLDTSASRGVARRRARAVPCSARSARSRQRSRSSLISANACSAAAIMRADSGVCSPPIAKSTAISSSCSFHGLSVGSSSGPGGPDCVPLLARRRVGAGERSPIAIRRRRRPPGEHRAVGGARQRNVPIGRQQQLGVGRRTGQGARTSHVSKNSPTDRAVASTRPPPRGSLRFR
jgi:hypothetical protein